MNLLSSDVAETMYITHTPEDGSGKLTLVRL